MLDFSVMDEPQIDAWALENDVDLSAYKTKAEKAARCTTANLEGYGKQKIEVMGVKVKISPSIFNDYEVVGMLGEVQAGNVFMMPKLFERVFGEDFPRIRAELTEHFGGNFNLAIVSAFFYDVMEAVDTKN